MNKDFQLDAHGEFLMQQYRERHDVYSRIEQTAFDILNNTLKRQGIYVTAIEHRVKEERSLMGKLELKGAKYHSLDDVTDIVGIRVITFYTDDVDKVAVVVKQIFNVDWDDSVDKRKQHSLDSFGYNSLHYICRLPQQVADPEEPLITNLRFEIQMRTALQHVWSTIEHDVGYKGAVKMPPEYRRQFNRLAGMIELIDDEFSRLRTTLTEYRRQMQQLVESGHLDEVSLNDDSFRSYLQTRPFDRLNQRIAAVNQAELFPTPIMPYLLVMQAIGMETLGDVQRLIDNYSDDAYSLAISQLATTDLDIVAETIGVMNLCCIYVFKQGKGRPGITFMFDILNGRKQENIVLAENILEQALTLPFMKGVPV